MRDYKIEKEFDYKGYKCVVVGQSLGHRCGYIGVNEENKIYGKDYDDLCDIEVHGGLTYSGDGVETDYPIKSNLWWIGYDCIHYGDGKDMNLIKELGSKEYYKHELLSQEKFPMINRGIVRTLGYCISECKNVVDQIIDINEK